MEDSATLTAAVIQVIEIATDLVVLKRRNHGTDYVFMTQFLNIISTIFTSALESLIHDYIKKILMILVDSAIDALVATFKDVGVFNDKNNRTDY